MAKTQTPRYLRDKLRSLGIREFDVLIHDQPRAWLLKYFSERATKYPINVELLCRNLIWQLRLRVQSGEKPPYRELIRTFWYMYLKPTLSRAGALSDESSQYKSLIKMLTAMVKNWRILEYKDIGFLDDNAAGRTVGENPHVILFSEKKGHHEFLKRFHAKYRVSILALGGQPSLMNIEYFVDDMKARGVDIRRTFRLLGIVDYDPSGWIIRDALVGDLARYGIRRVKVTDLIHPDMLTKDEIAIARVPVPRPKEMRSKNARWLLEIAKRRYRNQARLAPSVVEGKKVIWGLEAEAVSVARLERELDRILPELLKDREGMMRRIQFQELMDSLKDLIVHKTLAG